MNSIDTNLLNIYTKAAELRKMAPWFNMYEADVFGIHIKEAETDFYVSVIGSEGSFTAVSIYAGHEALGDFMELMLFDFEVGAEDVLMIPHLMLSFEDRDSLEKEERKKLKELGLKFRGSGTWPVLRKINPGHPPVFPKPEELRFMATVIEQTMLVARRAAKEELPFMQVNEDDEIVGLVRTGSAEAKPDSWKDAFATLSFETTAIPVQINRSAVYELGNLPQTDCVLQVDMPLMPTPINENGSSYFPFVFLVMDKESGYILHFELLTPDPSAIEMYGQCGNVLLEALLSNNLSPVAIEVKSPRLFKVFSSVLEQTNIRVVFKPTLPMLKKAFMSMSDF